MSTLSLLAFLPELVVLAGALLILLLDALGVRGWSSSGDRRRFDGGLAPPRRRRPRVRPALGDRDAFRRQIDVLPTQSALWTFTSLGLVFQAIFLLSAFFVALASLSRSFDERAARCSSRS